MAVPLPIKPPVTQTIYQQPGRETQSEELRRSLSALDVSPRVNPSLRIPISSVELPRPVEAEVFMQSSRCPELVPTQRPKRSSTEPLHIQNVPEHDKAQISSSNSHSPISDSSVCEQQMRKRGESFNTQILTGFDAPTTSDAAIATGKCSPTSGSVRPSVDSPTGGPSTNFWKPSVSRMYKIYGEPKFGTIFEALDQMNVSQWRDIISFLNDLHHFLKRFPHDFSQLPPEAPVLLLQHFFRAVLTQTFEPFEGDPGHARPVFYLELLQLIRSLMRPSSSNSRREGPTRVTRFCIHLLSAAPTATLLADFFGLLASDSVQRTSLTNHAANGCSKPCVSILGLDGKMFCSLDAAWRRNGGDFLLACQHVLVRLYPDGAENQRLFDLKREPLLPEDVPSFVCFIAAAGLHYGSARSGEAPKKNLLCAISNADGDTPSEKSSNYSPNHVEVATERTVHDYGSTPPKLHTAPGCSIGLDEWATSFAQRHSKHHLISDKFLISLRDTLYAFLGPGPAHPDGLPPSVNPPKIGSNDISVNVDIKLLARILRKIIQAYFMDPEDVGTTDFDGMQATCSKDSLGDPTDIDDIVPVANSGPLLRSAVFMETSALLQAIKRQLCAAPFADIESSSNQLEMYALRNLRLVWFDLRRCTSTLKHDLEIQSDKPANAMKTLPLLLVMKNMRFRLAHEWEAKLGRFPYMHLSGNSQVTVRDLAITIRIRFTYADGFIIDIVDVHLPVLDVQLTCESSFSQVALSALLKVFRASLQDQLQTQLQKLLFNSVRRAAEKTNKLMWDQVQYFLSERLVNKFILWVRTHIPREGLPI